MTQGFLVSSKTQFIFITLNYWAFTLTDGALRMLVLLHFHQLGFSPFALASLFLLYECSGVATNLIGGYFGARWGLNKTMHLGTALQVIALLCLSFPIFSMSIFWIMVLQALSGVAKDLNKMSAKTAVKFLVEDQSQKIFQWVAFLTGSKNALKGVGFFLGAALLSAYGFQQSLMCMACALAAVSALCWLFVTQDIGRSKQKPKFYKLFSKNSQLNFLAAARLFLFGARDIWFVVALPVFLSANLHWSFDAIGSFMALWIIGYGIAQSLAPKLLNKNASVGFVIFAMLILAFVAVAIASLIKMEFHSEETIVIGLLIFGFVFALISSVHSALIVTFANHEHASLDVGFYYMANALGRLIGTFLSGFIFQLFALQGCLWMTAIFLAIAAGFSLGLKSIIKEKI